jgi:2-dehydro-3-deoxyphosphogluconate aldolase/(4S)-4-hydroxy-2-oxoglutarate aldolase
MTVAVSLAAVPPVPLGDLLPVVTIHDPDDAPWLVDVLAETGYCAVEITLRTDAALPAIRAAVEVAPPGFSVGAGTIVDARQVSIVNDLGARFVVSPGYSTPVVAASRAVGLDVVPGIGSASDAMRAIADEVFRVKVFPVRELGGPAFIEALASPFPQLQFLPSGGVARDDAGQYASIPAVFCVSGSWMISAKAVRDRDRPAAIAESRAALESIASRGAIG